MLKKIKCEIYSRVCGYFRPTNQWNPGKKEEFKDRLTYDYKNNKKDDNSAEKNNRRDKKK